MSVADVADACQERASVSYDRLMRFDTKVAVILRDDLLAWQKLNVTAFTMTGVASLPDTLGEEYVDGSGRRYLPMLKQPVLIFGATADQMRQVYQCAISENLALAIYTAELFATPHDEANRAAVRNVSSIDLNLVGMSLRGPRKSVDRAVKDLILHP